MSDIVLPFKDSAVVPSLIPPTVQGEEPVVPVRYLSEFFKDSIAVVLDCTYSVLSFT